MQLILKMTFARVIKIETMVLKGELGEKNVLIKIPTAKSKGNVKTVINE